ncbi:MAG: YncE family protein [Deltaproteobacteria bacterium]|nr:YncE family protein [Deltaproteobacteria bacterium]
MRRFFYRCCFVVFLGLLLTETGHADILTNLESPAANQGASGISAISGWAFSSVPGARVTIQLLIDGTASGTIPCCSQRNDVNLEIPSGFALLFNFNLLSEGAHMITIDVQDDKGSPTQTQTHAITVAKPGGFEFLSDLTLADAKVSLSTDKQEIILEGAQAQDKATEATQKVNLQLAWQEATQAIGVVEAENVGKPSGGTNNGGGTSQTCADTNTCVAPTSIQLRLENPAPNTTTSSTQTVSGISVVSGWTFSPTTGAAIDSIQLRIDSGLVGEIPCCSDRPDVKAAYVGQSDELQQQALNSGFGSLQNFNLLDSGPHTLSVAVQDSTGATSTAESSIRTVKLADSEFLDQFDLSSAKVSLGGETLLVEDITVRDKVSQQKEQITASYVWEPNCQCFVAQDGCGNGTRETGEECDVNALDGQTCTSLGFSGGSLSCRPRCGTNDKNCFLPCAFELKNCTGRHFLYVTNGTSNTVSVISPTSDPDTNPTVATIKVGKGPRGAAVSPDGARVYVCNFNSNTLSVISTATNTVTDTINVGDGPWAVAVTPDGTKVYVVNALDNSVSVVNAATKKVQTLIKDNRISQPQDIALAPDGKQGYVTNYGGNSVAVLDLNTNKVVDVVLVGKGPDGVAVSPDNTKVYVVNYGTNDVDGNSVTVLDRASNTVTGTVQVQLQPTKVAVSPDSTKAYVSNSVSGTISVINTSDLTIEDTITVGGDPPTQPEGLVVTTGGTRLYVALFGRGFGRDFLEISTGTSTVLQDISVGDGPFAVAVSPAAK